MTPITGGKHCGHCAKTVVDFTQMSDQEIKVYFKSHKGRVCGHFHSNQLRTLGEPFRQKNRFWPAAVLGSVLAFLGISEEGRGQEPVQAVLHYRPSKTKGQKEEEKQKVPEGALVKIRGVVTDKDKLVLPGVVVRVKETPFGAISDIDGVFELDIEEYLFKEEGYAILAFQYVGYESKGVKVKLDMIEEVLQVQLKEGDNVLIGEVVITGGYLGGLWWCMKKKFLER
ncbi:hypothetical protein GCM10023331_20980 [Algivirga pacifica]|uniref:CarboxypepD_reg-like domain-containing protein n=2 Tax=Algivirga pacifica TaxID=1162670 RepID=A0ABP9DBT0_9BACT